MKSLYHRDSIFRTGIMAKKRPFELPQQYKEQIALNSARQDFHREKDEILQEFRREKAEIEKMRKEQYEQLMEKQREVIPLDVVPALTKTEKKELKPTEQKKAIIKKQKDIEEAQELHEYLNQAPPKPVDGLLKKLVKKQEKKKYSSKTKKKAKQIFEVESKLEENKNTSDKVLQMIQNGMVSL
jgi:hypothetical protein